MHGLSSNITTALSKSPRLFVIAGESTANYKGQPPEVRKVSEELGVQYVLRGEVLAAENRLRISAQLYDALTGRCKWAEKYDIDSTKLFDTLDQITLSVAKATLVEITHGEQLRKGKGTKNLDAFVLTQHGWDVGNQLTKEAIFEARQLYEKALEFDPNYSDALSRLAVNYSVGARYKWDEEPAQSSRRAAELAERAIELAERAIELDESSSIAFSVLAELSRQERDFDRALYYHRKAIEANPNDQYSHYSMGATTYFSGNFEDAVPLLEKAVRLSPFCPSVYLYSLGRA